MTDNELIEAAGRLLGALLVDTAAMNATPTTELALWYSKAMDAYCLYESCDGRWQTCQDESCLWNPLESVDDALMVWRAARKSKRLGIDISRTTYEWYVVVFGLDQGICPSSAQGDGLARPLTIACLKAAGMLR